MNYLIEEIAEDGSVARVLATADNGILGKAAFEAACRYLPKARLCYRVQARVIRMQEPEKT